MFLPTGSEGMFINYVTQLGEERVGLGVTPGHKG